MRPKRSGPTRVASLVLKPAQNAPIEMGKARGGRGSVDGVFGAGHGRQGGLANVRGPTPVALTADCRCRRAHCAGATPGTWVPVAKGRSLPVDNGKTHASKDFWDSVKRRRILWVWGTVPSGIQTVPRVLTYHPQLEQLVYTPAVEVAALRTRVIGRAGPALLAPGAPALALPAAAAADIEVVFARPAGATRLALSLAGGIEAYIDYAPPPPAAAQAPYTVAVGLAVPPGPLAKYMPQTDLPGDDYNVTNVEYADPK